MSSPFGAPPVASGYPPAGYGGPPGYPTAPPSGPGGPPPFGVAPVAQGAPPGPLMSGAQVYPPTAPPGSSTLPEYADPRQHRFTTRGGIAFLVFFGMLCFSAGSFFMYLVFPYVVAIVDAISNV